MTLIKRLVLLINFIIFLVYASCSNSNQSDYQGDPASNGSEVIQDFLEGYYDTMSKRDWKAFRSFFWENATITTIWQKSAEDSSSVHVTTIDDFIAQTPQGPDSQPIFEEKMVGSEIEVRRNLAIAWARYTAKFGTTDDLMEWDGTDLFTLMKHKGQWKIVSLTFEADQ